MRIKRFDAFVTLETAVALGTYLTILGSFILSGIVLYQNRLDVLEQTEKMKSVDELCQWRRRIELLDEI